MTYLMRGDLFTVQTTALSQACGSNAEMGHDALLDACMHMQLTQSQMIWPGLVVVVSVLTFNRTGNALRDALAE